MTGKRFGGKGSFVLTAGRPIVDGLERRQHFSISQNAAGFTVITPEIGDRVIYVSSSAGSDSNTGLSSATPLKTIAAGKSLVRSGTGDQLLLKRGDTWHETLGVWVKGGKSATNPVVIGAYGSGTRPIVATGSGVALATGSTGMPIVNNLAIVGIRFYADTRDPSSSTYTGTAGNEGVRLLAGTSSTLVEDVEIDGYTTNLNIAGYFGAASNVVVRRSVVIDSYNTAGNSEGLYAEKVNGLKLEENVFDHNGWNTAAGAVQTIFNHNAYIKESVNSFVARGNLFANASSHGLQARAGGVIDSNTFLNNPIGLSFGLVNGSPVKAGGVSGQVTNNVFLGGGSIAGSVRGWGIEVSNTKAGAGTKISGNVFSGSPAGSGYAISLGVGSNVTNPTDAVGINDLTIENNVVYNWTTGLIISNTLVSGGSGATGLNGLIVRNNDFQRIQKQTVLNVGDDFTTSAITFAGNRYDSAAGAVLVNTGGQAVAWTSWAGSRDGTSVSAQVAYPTATRGASTYAVALGVGSTTAAYITAARGLSTSSWTGGLRGSSVADYIRGGFGFSSTGTIDAQTIDLTVITPSPPVGPPPPPIVTVPPAPPPPPNVPPSPPPPPTRGGGHDHGEDGEDDDHREDGRNRDRNKGKGKDKKRGSGSRRGQD